MLSAMLPLRSRWLVRSRGAEPEEEEEEEEDAEDEEADDAGRPPADRPPPPPPPLPVGGSSPCPCMLPRARVCAGRKECARQAAVALATRRLVLGGKEPHFIAFFTQQRAFHPSARGVLLL
jgi:hypothetical protein